MAHHRSSSIATIFKRGGQKSEYSAASGEGGDAFDADQQLEQHLQQLAVAWAAPKVRWVCGRMVCVGAARLLLLCLTL